MTQPTVGVVVVTHGQLANELLNATEMIAGELPHFEAVALGWHDDPNAAKDQIAGAIERVRGGAGVLILTDMFGGTPSNLGITFLEDQKIEVVTGVNLPMLVKLASVRVEKPLALAIQCAQEAGRKYINVASQVLAGQ